MGLSSSDWEKRKLLMEKLQGAIADVERFEKEERDAHSAYRSASVRLSNARIEYTRVRKQLEKLLPEVDQITAEQTINE